MAFEFLLMVYAYSKHVHSSHKPDAGSVHCCCCDDSFDFVANKRAVSDSHHVQVLVWDSRLVQHQEPVGRNKKMDIARIT